MRIRRAGSKDCRADGNDPEGYAGKARKHRESHTYVAKNMEEMGNILNNTPGFVKAMWCGCQECEDKIKEQFAATSRCMPFEQETLSDTCVCCGKPAKKMVYWGKAY